MAVDYARVGPHERVCLRIVGAYGVNINGRHASPGDIVDCMASDALFLLGRQPKCCERFVEPVKETPVPHASEETEKVQATDEVTAPKKVVVPAVSRPKPQGLV